MKKIMLMVVIVIAMGFSFMFGRAYQKEITYALSGKVYEVNIEEDTVTIVDCNGFLWSFYGTEDWMVGDNVACVMEDNGTEIIFDDILIPDKIRYEGNINWK